MLMAIFLVYSTSGITFGKKFAATSQWRPFLNFEKLNTASFDLKYDNIVPNYAKKVFYMIMTSSTTSQGGLKVNPLYSFINELS